MEVQQFDKFGNKIEKNDVPNPNQPHQDNNPKIIRRSRLDDLPVVRMNFNENQQQNSQQTFQSCQSKDVKLQTSVKKEKSKYEVDKDTTFKVNLGVMFDEDRIVIIPEEKFEEIDGLGVELYEKHWVKFRMWNFLESASWRQECMEFLQQHRIFNLNTNKFNELKVRRLLLDWSFKDYGDDHKLFHINSQLTDESMTLFFKKFNPHIVQYVLNKMNEFLGD